MKKIITTIRVFVVFLVLLGIIYPLFVTGIAQLTMPYEANGSLIEKNGVIIGSAHIGQQFLRPQYFHGRFFAPDDVASNLEEESFAPTSKKLISITKRRITKVRDENNISANHLLPADMVLTSASGLDPHISLENAYLQLPRVARYRHLAEAKIKKIILNNIDADFMGIWGNEGVNVLLLNIELDQLSHRG